LSAVVGERDKALRATFPRNINPTAGVSLLLDADPPAFHQNSAGIPTIPSAKFRATPVGFAGTVMWSITSGGKLTGATPNERTLLFSDMTADSVKVTVTIVHQGEALIRVRTFFKLTDGAAGSDAPPVDMSPAAILAALEGRITDSQLYADLRTRINLIDSPATVLGSVTARIKAETDARVSAIGSATAKSQQDLDKEISDRIAAVLAESGARATYVQNYTFSKQETTSALSIQATQIAAAATAYTDQKTGTILSTAAADVRTYSYSKADTTSAISAAETRLRSEFNSAGGVTQADIQNWSYSKAQSDSAEAAQTSSLTTAYKGYADLKKSEAKADAAADVRNYAYSKSDANAAEAAQSADLTTKYTAYADAARANAISAASADVRNYSYAKSATDSAIAAAESRLRSEFVGSGGATEAYVTGYAYSKSQIDQSEAAQTSQIRTAYINYADSAGQYAINTAYADVRNYAYSKSNSDSALAAQANTLRAEFSSTNGVTTAYLENYAYSKAQTNSAITQQTSTLVSTVGQHTTAIQQQFTSLDGLSGQLVWKIDNNNHVTGFGLASTPINGVPYSTMIFNVDVLAVALPGGSGKPIFTVGQVNGQTQAVFRTDLFVDGGIRASALAIGNADQVVPDSNMLDANFWKRPESEFLSYSATFWKSSRVLTVYPENGYEDTFTKYFPVARGGTYLFEFQSWVGDGYVGPSSIFAYIPGFAWYQMGGPSRGYPFSQDQGNSETMQVMFDQNSPKGGGNWAGTLTIPDTADTGTIAIRVITACRGGYIQFGGVKITRVMDQTLIGPGSVYTKHLDIATGGDIHSGQTGFDLGNGFWLEGEGRGHGARMSIGRQNGRKIIIDPANNRLELVDPQIGANMTASMAPASYNVVRNANQQFNDVYAGNYTASAGNSSGNLAYQWSISSENSAITANISSPRSSGTRITVSGKLFLDQEVNVLVMCVVTDLNNGVSRGASASINIQVQ
jgi:hypothetical protein